MGSVVSFSRHSAWNISSACARVLTNTMVMPASRMRAITPGAASSPIWPAQDSSPSGSIIANSGGAPSGSSMTRSAPT